MPARVLSNLSPALAEAPPGVPLEVIVTFNRPLSQVDPALLPWTSRPERLNRAFPAAWAVACRLLPEEMEALVREGVVARLEADAEVHTCQEGSNRFTGALAARADLGVTGDGDGDPNSYSERDTTIALLDSGIDANHVDFAGGKVIAWKDFVSGRAEPYDDNGHGTHCASIAAGRRLPEAGGAAPIGVAPGAALVVLKVLGRSGAGRMRDIAAGLQYCIDERESLGIRVVNMSMGTDGSSDGEDFGSRMVNRAVAAGLVVVVAAGNEGPRTHTIGSPAAAEDAITVGSMADPGAGGFALSPFSSRGPTEDGRYKPDLCAPGEGIRAARAGTASGYIRYSGTSMAAPFVAGVAALVLTANPSLSPAEVKETLMRTAVDFGLPGRDNDYGAGRLDAYRAVSAARGTEADDPDAPVHAAVHGHLEDGETRTLPIQVSATSFPVAATLLILNWAPSGKPDFDLRLRDPSGQVLVGATTPEREERLRFTPSETGTYTLEVISVSGAGDFALDLSGAVEATGR
jgi:serine protease AprX